MSQDVSLDQAELALNNGDPVSAERLLTQNWPDITKAPGDAQHLMAMIRASQKRWAEAEQFMRGAVRSEPSSLRHNIALGHILTEAKNHTGAAEAYANAAKIDPKWPGLMLVLSQAHYRAGRFADAERAARQGIAAPNAAIWNALAAALREQGKLPDALNATDEALRCDWQDVDAQHGRAAILLMMGRPSDALEIFDGLAAQGIDLPVLHLNRAAALEALGRKDEARTLYEELARRWPDLPNLQQRVADARKRV